jgi:hypothetical protein
VNLVARNYQQLEEAFQELEEASEKTEFTVNEIKMKHMINTRNKVGF